MIKSAFSPGTEVRHKDCPDRRAVVAPDVFGIEGDSSVLVEFDGAKQLGAQRIADLSVVGPIAVKIDSVLCPKCIFCNGVQCFRWSIARLSRLQQSTPEQRNPVHIYPDCKAEMA